MSNASRKTISGEKKRKVAGRNTQNGKKAKGRTTLDVNQKYSTVEMNGMKIRGQAANFLRNSCRGLFISG